MLIDTKNAEPADALTAVLELLPQLGTTILETIRRRTIPAILNRKVRDAAQRVGLDEMAALLTVADIVTTASGGAQLGIAEIDDTPGAIVCGERDEDGDPIDEPTPLVSVQPYEIGPEAVAAAMVELNEIDAE